MADLVCDEIIKVFERELGQHLFSDKELPLEVEVRTVYSFCTQSIKIKF